MERIKAKHAKMMAEVAENPVVEKGWMPSRESV
jgi:hypothetical protein